MKYIQVLVVCLTLIMVGCSSQQPIEAPPLPPKSDVKVNKANDVLFGALGLVGTPYRYGGNSPETGFDCSGLIGYVFRENADVRLPRTVAEINKLSVPDVAENNLTPGDVVIFATRKGKPDHAGIYVGDGRFVHAPSSGGFVRMDKLDQQYWQRSYLNAKRPLAKN